MITFRGIKYYIETYIASVPIVFRGMCNIFKPSQVLAFVQDVLNAKDIKSDCPYLGSKNILEILGDSSFRKDIVIKGKYYLGDSGGTHMMPEIATLALVCKVINPKLIFEFGTFIGSTTRIFSLNTAPEAAIITLDLPAGATAYMVGRDVVGTPEENKIQFISGDSNRYDFSEWYGKCDLVWVDGCHDYEYVKHDTKNALKLVKTDGWVMWHDYRHTAYWSGVTKYLREIKKDFPGITHIRGTTIAILNKKS